MIQLINKLLEECKKSDSQYLYTAVVLALSTGGRKAEILGLTWKDINFNRGIITLHETKNGERRRALPLAGHARDLMQQMCKIRLVLGSLLGYTNKRLSKEVTQQFPE